MSVSIKILPEIGPPPLSLPVVTPSISSQWNLFRCLYVPFSLKNRVVNICSLFGTVTHVTGINTLAISILGGASTVKTSISTRVQAIMVKWTDYRNNALLTCSDQGHFKRAKFFIFIGADVNALCSKTTPLLKTLCKKHFDIAKLLIQSGADVRFNLYQILHGLVTTFENQPDNIEYFHDILKNIHVNINETDENGDTLLHAAINVGHIKIAEFLIACGANLDCVNNSDYTPLLLAIEIGDFDLIKLLIRSNADVNKPTRLGINGNFALAMFKISSSEKKREWEEIISALATASSQAFEDIKEIRKIKIIAHLANLAGTSKLVKKTDKESRGESSTEEFELEGSDCSTSTSLISECIQTFHSTFPDSISGQTQKLIADLYQIASKEEVSDAEVFTRWQSGSPILISTGYIGHIASVLIWKNYFIHCDGAKGFKEDAISVANFNEALFSQEHITKIKAAHLKKGALQYANLLFQELPESLGFSHQEFTAVADRLNNLRMPLMVVPNCAWANIESQLLPLLILNACKEQRIENNDEKIEFVVKQQEIIYQNLKSFMLVNLLDNYLDNIKGKDYGYQPDFNFLSKVFESHPKGDHIDPRIVAKWNQCRQKLNGLMQDP